ncbi:hypothetical protein [Thermoclostridium caenicola]|nr:hypothetical protein [Thermoclostridium caenicola]
MYAFNKLPPNQFALLAAFLGVLLNFALNSEEKAALGNFIISIGQTMLTARPRNRIRLPSGRKRTRGGPAFSRCPR